MTEKSTPTTLPVIEFPNEPLSPAWRETVELLVQRAEVVAQWAEDAKERAQSAIDGHEAAWLGLSALLEGGRIAEASTAAREAADAIIKARGLKPVQAH